MRGVMHDGGARLDERDGARQRREEHEQEEHESDHLAGGAQAVEQLGQRAEHQARTGLFRNRIAAAEGDERGRDDHETCKEGYEQVKARDARGGLDDVLLLLEVAAVGDHDAHGKRQAVEHLAERADEQLGRELGEVGGDIIQQSVDRAGKGQRVDGQRDGHDDERRHHDEIGFLDAAFDAERDDDEGSRHEDRHEHEARHGTRDEPCEISVAGDGGRLGDIGERIFGHPAADDAVVRRDDEGHEGRQDADGQVLTPEMGEGADRRQLRAATERDFENQHRYAEREDEHDIGEKEHASAVLGRKIREAPHIAQADRRCRSRQDEHPFARPRGSGLSRIRHFLSLLAALAGGFAKHASSARVGCDAFRNYDALF